MTNYFKHKLRTKTPAAIVSWVVLGVAAVAGFAILFGFVIMWLWNALMPDVFGLVEINYWQAVGLLLLFKILFGGFSGSSKNKSSSNKKHKAGDARPKSDFSKWELYDKFWEEEGDEAYRDYIKRANEIDNKE